MSERIALNSSFFDDGICAAIDSQWEAMPRAPTRVMFRAKTLDNIKLESCACSSIDPIGAGLFH